MISHKHLEMLRESQVEKGSFQKLQEYSLFKKLDIALHLRGFQTLPQAVSPVSYGLLLA